MSQLPPLSELLQPFNRLLATEGDDDTLINEPTGLCVTCAASGTLTHTAFARKIYAKVNGPEIATKHHHACDVTRKEKYKYDFPSGPIRCGSQSCGACSKIACNRRGTYICNRCETRMNATVTKTNRSNRTPCSWLSSKLTGVKQRLQEIIKKSSLQAELPH